MFIYFHFYTSTIFHFSIINFQHKMTFNYECKNKTGLTATAFRLWQPPPSMSPSDCDIKPTWRNEDRNCLDISNNQDSPFLMEILNFLSANVFKKSLVYGEPQKEVEDTSQADIIFKMRTKDHKPFLTCSECNP